MSLGEARIVRTYSFEAFDAETEDLQVKLLREYADSQGHLNLPALKLVSFLLRQLNDAVQAAMSKEGLPFLSHHYGRISTFAGRPTINRPYRDAVSVVNVLQLEEWFVTGEKLFSFEQLEHFIQPEI